MTAWIIANIGTILVSLVLILIVAGIVFYLVRQKKSGKSSCSCGGNCSSCGVCPHCNPTKPAKK